MRIKAFTAAMSMLAIVSITLGVWFSPSHGQPHQQMAQQIDVNIVDDEGDQVAGASVNVERFDGGRWTRGGTGGATDTGGNSTVEMATTPGRYRVVLTVPAGYTEDYDDADGGNPGPNNECSGMTRRCVVYQVDANRTARLQNPQPGADGLSFTFYVRDDIPEPRAHLVQQDVTDGTPKPLYGGTIKVTPTHIVRVNGQDVVQRGRTTSYHVSTSGRTVMLNAGSYEIEWVPPTGFTKVNPTWKHSATVPTRGSISLTFTARTGALDNDESYGQIDPEPAGEQLPAPGGWSFEPAYTTEADTTVPATTVPEPSEAADTDDASYQDTGTHHAGEPALHAPSPTTVDQPVEVPVEASHEQEQPPTETHEGETYDIEHDETETETYEAEQSEGETYETDEAGLEVSYDESETIVYEYDELCGDPESSPICAVVGPSLKTLDISRSG